MCVFVCVCLCVFLFVFVYKYKPMFTPVNQTLYWRARSLSYGIENDDTGDVKQRKAIRAL